MEDDYNIFQDSVNPPLPRNLCSIPEFDPQKEYPDIGVFEESYGDLDDGNGYRNNRGGRGNYRGRGRGWNGPPMRYRGRGYGPSGPPRGRGYYRGRGGPRYNNNYDWGPPPQIIGNYGPPIMGPLPMGPPPTMMGQPPPYAPPNLPPPNMPAPEIWVETKSEDGNLYYYHSRTRETTWTRPVETPVCKVITQGEMEASVTGQNPAATVPQIHVNMGSMTHMGVPQGPPPLGPFSQPPPWGLDDGLREDLQASPRDNVSPGDSGLPAQPPNGYPANAQNNLEDSFEALTMANPTGNPEGDEGTSSGDQELQLAQANGNINGGVRARAFIQCQQIIRKTKTTILLLERYGGDQSPGGDGVVDQLPSSPSDRQVSQGESGQPAQAPNGAVASAQTPPEPPPIEEIPIPPNLFAACAKWTQHKAPGGRFYYYNIKRNISTWEKPLPLRQLDEFKANVAAHRMGIPMPDMIEYEGKTEVIDLDEYEEEQLAAEKEREDKQREEEERAERDRAEQERLEKEKEESERVQREREESERVERERIEREKELEKLEATLEEMDGKAEEPIEEAEAILQEEETPGNVEENVGIIEETLGKVEEKVGKIEEKVETKTLKPEGKQEKAKTDRGITSTPIFGTPWCVVWTYEGHVFFYNPTAPASVWERPAELAGRADVDRAVSQPPPAYLQRKKAEAAAELKRVADTDPQKKPDDGSKKQHPIQMNVGQSAAIGAEMRAAVERAKLPFSTRLDTFVQMLRDRQVSAFSTWEKELQKIVFDSRYLLLNYKERKEVFDKFVRERAEEERKEKKSRLQQKRAAFRDLLDEARLHSKSLFAEFAIKYAKDERFKGVEKPREREAYFAEYVLALRQKEKEEKDRRREQAKAAFMAMLKETGVDRHARWADVKKRLDGDARYKAVDSSSLKEHYFQDYCRLLKEERRRDKDKERDGSTSKKESKEKDKEKKGACDKSDSTTEERQPTPPPEEWADILGIPEEKRRLAEKRLAEKKLAESKAKKADLKSPLQSPKEKSPAKVERKSPLKSPKAKPKTEKAEKIKSPVTSPQGKREMKAEVRIVPLENMALTDSDDEKLSQSVEQKKSKKKVDSPEVEKKRLRSSKCQVPQVTVAEKRKKVPAEEQKKGKEKKRRRKNEKD